MKPASNAGEGPVGIKEIAVALGISIGTVDRALHGRAGISAVTRSKVLQVAQSMRYRPNLAARYLKSRRQLRIAVHLPEEIASFFNAVRRGIEEASAPLQPAVSVALETYPRLGEGDAELLDRCLNNGSNGVIICPGAPAALKPRIRRAARKNVPIVCVASDAPKTERLTAISACPHTSGRMAGELLCRTTNGRGGFAVFTGSMETEDHVDKIHGFQSIVHKFSPRNGTVAVIETHDDPKVAYQKSMKLLRRSGELRGVYISTANSLPVLKAIEDVGLSSKVAVVATDLFPELIPLIQSGRVLATIDQQPAAQGRMAFEALYQFLIERKCPPTHIKIVPHLVLMSNLELFMEG